MGLELDGGLACFARPDANGIPHGRYEYLPVTNLAVARAAGSLDDSFHHRVSHVVRNDRSEQGLGHRRSVRHLPTPPNEDLNASLPSLACDVQVIKPGASNLLKGCGYSADPLRPDDGLNTNHVAPFLGCRPRLTMRAAASPLVLIDC